MNKEHSRSMQMHTHKNKFWCTLFVHVLNCHEFLWWPCLYVYVHMLVTSYTHCIDVPVGVLSKWVLYCAVLCLLVAGNLEIFTALIRNKCMFFIIYEKLEVLSELINPVTNQTLIMKYRPVIPGWKVSRTSVAMCTYTRVGHNLCNPNGFLLSFVNLWVLIYLYTCKSLLNTIGRTVEQLAVCLARQAKVSSWDQSTTVPLKWLMIIWWDVKPGVSPSRIIRT